MTGAAVGPALLGSVAPLNGTDVFAGLAGILAAFPPFVPAASGGIRPSGPVLGLRQSACSGPCSAGRSGSLAAAPSLRGSSLRSGRKTAGPGPLAVSSLTCTLGPGALAVSAALALRPSSLAVSGARAAGSLPVALSALRSGCLRVIAPLRPLALGPRLTCSSVLTSGLWSCGCRSGLSGSRLSFGLSRCGRLCLCPCLRRSRLLRLSLRCSRLLRFRLRCRCLRFRLRRSSLLRFRLRCICLLSFCLRCCSCRCLGLRCRRSLRLRLSARLGLRSGLRRRRLLRSGLSRSSCLRFWLGHSRLLRFRLRGCRRLRFGCSRRLLFSLSRPSGLCLRRRCGSFRLRFRLSLSRCGRPPQLTVFPVYVHAAYPHGRDSPLRSRCRLSLSRCGRPPQLAVFSVYVYAAYPYGRDSPHHFRSVSVSQQLDVPLAGRAEIGLVDLVLL